MTRRKGLPPADPSSSGGPPNTAGLGIARKASPGGCFGLRFLNQEPAHGGFGVAWSQQRGDLIVQCGDPKVLHVIAPALAGGAETVVRRLAGGAHRRGADVEVATLLGSRGEHPLVDLLRQDGLPVADVRCGRRRYLAEIRALSHTIRMGGARLVHTHVYHGDFVGYWAARRCGVPVVATVHGFTNGDVKNRFYQWLDLRLLRRFDAVLCVTDAIRDRVLAAGCPAMKTHLVPNGLGEYSILSRSAARAQFGLKSCDVVLGWVGRLSCEKGPDLFVDAVAALRPPRPVVLLIGDGPERGSLEARIAVHGLTEKHVRLAGYRPDAARLLRAFDVLVMSSRTEGAPMVLLEALAAGVPVVSFAVGGIPDMVDSSAVWLVPPGDTAAMTAAIVSALSSPRLTQEEAKGAEQSLEERFGIDQWLDRVYAIYRKVCGT